MTDSIERTMELHAPPERVWRAISDPGELRQWFAEEADLELVPGREGWFGWEAKGRFNTIVEVVEPPVRLVWRWSAAADVPVEEGDATTVEWSLARRPDGGTTLRLVETGFATEAARAENDQGWTDELRELFAFLDAEAAGEPAPGSGEADDDAGDGPPLSPAPSAF